MNLILKIPFDVRLLALFVLGTALGSLINLGIYRLAYFARAISPWSAPLPNAPPRRRSDRLPIVGWFGLRREAQLHGTGFWIRPMLIELICGVGLAALYWWEIGSEGLLPEQLQFALNGRLAAAQKEAAAAALHWVFLAHTCLLVFMFVASLIDIDEQMIPDEITLPGTLLALLLASLLPQTRLPTMHDVFAPGGMAVAQHTLSFLTFASPQDWPWPGELKGVPEGQSLAIGLGCLWLWCVALLPRHWRRGRGLRISLAIFWRHLAHNRLTLWLSAIGVFASAGIFAVWRQGGERWEALLSALVGMAAGGGVVWVVRIIGRIALRREAMGFGDVTLMAMIGAFLGWQPCLMIFFMAPLSAIGVGIAQWLLSRNNEIRYGPFLCLAALVVMLYWAAIWEGVREFFAVGWLIPMAMGVCLLMIGPLLIIVRQFTKLVVFVFNRLRGAGRE